MLALVVLWVVVWSMTKGDHLLEIGTATRTGVHDWFQARSEWVETAESSGSNAVINALGALADALRSVYTFLQRLFTVAVYPRPYPEIGWLGIVVAGATLTFAAAGWRLVLLVVPSLLAFGFLGYWEDSIDLLLVVGLTVVMACAIGIPLGVWMGHSRTVTAILTPFLDFMQTMPSLVYLLPFVILFGTGSSAAIMVTLVYAAPPVVRITAHGIRNVDAEVLEATDSLGQGRARRLFRVELPLARRTIIVGVNQTIMAAFSMATVAALIAGPGLGGPVLEGQKRGQLGAAFVAGVAIVIMAVMLDRTVTAASVRTELANRSGHRGARLRAVVLGAGAVATAVAIYLSHNYVWANQFPDQPDLGAPIRERVDEFGRWLRADLSGFTSAISDGFTNAFLNPVQSLIAESPWFVSATAILLVAAIIGGRRALAVTVVCLAGLVGLDLWHNAMVTLTAVLVATVVVVALAVVIGVVMGRSPAADRVLRPLLDAGQTIPPFVPLILVLILFGATRFSSIVAGVIYASPVAIKLVADGIRGVSPETVEAARSAGSNRWQEITKVQLPMARGSLVLATNQGLLYVLSMVVIGGTVGAQALGFDVYKGSRLADYNGKGLAAGLCIVLLGIMLDRITTYGAQRSARHDTSQPRKVLTP